MQAILPRFLGPCVGEGDLECTYTFGMSLFVRKNIRNKETSTNLTRASQIQDQMRVIIQYQNIRQGVTACWEIMYRVVN